MANGHLMLLRHIAAGEAHRVAGWGVRAARTGCCDRIRDPEVITEQLVAVRSRIDGMIGDLAA